ncbi:protein XRP2-like isoform X2 [Rhopilema esculentum]|uniref:protein XRP2-like isoform X2 n=1 Tax=Rhopilema esculentum TaxID=499914 RepID=UPI0031D0AC01
MGCVQSKHEEADSESKKEETVYSWDRPGRPDPADFTIENQDGTVTGRLPGKIDGQQFIIKNCKDSQIYLFDHSATITVDDCERCKFVFGPIKGSIFFRNCKDCQAVVACQQFRTRDCKKLDIFLHCVSQPIIEASTGMKFACYQYAYPELKDQFQKAGLSLFSNNWFNIHDFTPVAGEANWSLLPETATVDHYVPFPNTEEFNSVNVSSNADEFVVPVTRGSREKKYDESCLLLFFGNAITRCMEFTNELKKKATFDIVQTKEVKMTAEDASRILRNENFADAVAQGPAVGVEVNGENMIQACLDVRSDMRIEETVLHISGNKDEAQREIDAFYNFVDITMS